MSLKEFVDKWNGKYCEMGGSANALNQCTDLVNAYIKEVLGLPIVLGTNAVDFPKKVKSSDYEYILNTPTAVPIQGDIMIYESPDGIGHIDIFDNGDSSKFVAFSQNWPVDSVCKLVNHTYTGTYKVIGWLRRKSSIIQDMTDIISSLIKENGITEGDIRWLIDLKAKQTVSKLEEQVKELQDKIYEYEIQVQELLAEITQNQKEISSWQSNYESANEQFSIVTEQLENMTEDRNKYRRLYEAQLNNTLTTAEYFKLFIKSLFKK